MAYWISFALLLVASTTFAHSFKIVDYASASVNDWADRMMAHLRPRLIELNADPLKAPALNLNFSFDFLFQTHQGQLNLSDGWIIGISTIERHSDCAINYDLHLLRLDLSLKIKELLMDFHYDLSALGMEPSGNLQALVTDQIIEVGVLIDTKEATASLQHLDMPNDGKLKIDIDGLGILGNALADVILTVVDTLWKDKVMDTVSKTMEEMISNFLSDFHPLPTIPPATSAQPFFV